MAQWFTSEFSGGRIKDFDKLGSVNLGIFDWWKTQTLAGIPEAGERSIMWHVQVEYDIYLHHLREINGRPNKGWLRNMWYSIGQQLMRMDPLYYRLYFLLRSDHPWMLISFPYYAKYAMAGDQTGFRHIDINTKEACRGGRGVDMIQGSLTIDDEDDKNCTIILPKMHRPENFTRWFDRVRSRNPDNSTVLDNLVSRIDDTHWTKADANEFQTDWTTVPCQAGQVRITDPRIPHGSTPKPTRVRRTMLPWFVRIQDDHTHLEVTTGST